MSSQFNTTHWSVVLACTGDDTAAHQALSDLCEMYWYPLYVYVRRLGKTSQDSEDLIQGFFLRMLEKDSLAAADPGRGRFRTFLLSMLNHYMAKEWRKTGAVKRGGNAKTLSLDFELGSRSFNFEPHHDRTPELAYEREWAVNLINGVISSVQSEYERDNKSGLFECVQTHFGGVATPMTYQEIAAKCGMTAGAVKVAAHRLRKRIAERLFEEISRTVSEEDDVDREMEHLHNVLG